MATFMHPIGWIPGVFGQGLAVGNRYDLLEQTLTRYRDLEKQIDSYLHPNPKL